MLRPVSLANCSRICRVGLGVWEKAVFRTSNCLALMVVRGPRRFPPAPSSTPSKENSCKVHTFWEGHKVLQNLHRRFVLSSNGQMYGGDFIKYCGLLRIYELTKVKISLENTYINLVFPADNQGDQKVKTLKYQPTFSLQFQRNFVRF